MSAAYNVCCMYLQLDCSTWQHHIAHALGAASGRCITPSLGPLAALLKSTPAEEEEQFAQQAEALVDAVPNGMLMTKPPMCLHHQCSH